MTLTTYYGIDWTAGLLIFFSIYFLGEHRRSGFIYGAIGNFLWLIFGILANSTAAIVSAIAFIVINLRGYFKWTAPSPPSPSTHPQKNHPHDA